jgi:DNA-directed RNA polymerase specialized sigma24 family protein
MNSNADEAYRRAAEELLASTSGGARGDALNPVVTRLHRHVDHVVRSVIVRNGRLPDLSVSSEDVVSHVVIQLLKSPPSRATNGVDAFATLTAWIKTVTQRHLVDLSRRSKSMREIRRSLSAASGDIAPLPEGVRRGAMPAPPDEVEAADYEEKFLRYLERAYPPGYRLLAAELESPGLSGEELAQWLGTSRDNVYQIRKRLSDHDVRFKNMAASLKG